MRPMGLLAKAAHRFRDTLDPVTANNAPSIQASSSVTTLSSLSISQALLNQSVSRNLAMSVPTIERAHDVLTGTVASLPIRYWARRPVDIDDVEREPEQWMWRPDPNHAKAYTVAKTVGDLIFHPQAFWRIRERHVTGFPASFEWMPYDEVQCNKDQWGTVIDLTWRGNKYRPDDVIAFDGLGPGLLAYGWRAICIALKLDEAAERFADVPIPAGWLKQTGGEEYSTEELAEIADFWESRRMARVTGALSVDFDYHEGTQNPERLQLMEARQHQALELSRMMNVPPWIVGAPQGASMTYMNATQARLDLIDFGALPLVTVLEGTLSGPNVTPRGSYCKFDTDAWLRNPLLATPGATGGAIPDRGDPVPAPEMEDA